MSATTGTDAIRQALRAWKLSLGGLARELGVTIAQLEAFAAGGELAPDSLKALTKLLFQGHAIWDESIDRLKPANQEEPRALGSGPPPFVPTPREMPKYVRGPQPVTEEPEKAKLTWYGHSNSAPQQQEVSLGSPPPPLDPATLPKFSREPKPGPQLVDAPKQETKKHSRPGWVDTEW